MHGIISYQHIYPLQLKHILKRISIIDTPIKTCVEILEQYVKTIIRKKIINFLICMKQTFKHMKKM